MPWAQKINVVSLSKVLILEFMANLFVWIKSIPRCLLDYIDKKSYIQAKWQDCEANDVA